MHCSKIAAKKIKLPFKLKEPVLALGSHVKNAICFARGNFVFFSKIHHDLSTPKDFFDFERKVKYFLKKRPKIIAYDPHPEYQSTKYAQRLSPITYHLSPIQHHHAHIVSCMADNGLANQRVIGAAFDGTGKGSDNTLWGAEFLICDYRNFKRVAHLKEIPLLGGERAIREPWRLAAWWLYLAYKDKFLNLGVNFVKGIDRRRWETLKNMYLSDFNSPQSSSMGRLFDAVASLVLVKYEADFEAELAMELEKLAAAYKPGAGSQEPGVSAYPFRIMEYKDKYILNPLPMFKQIVSDLKAKEPKGKIAYRIHLTVAQMLRKTCLLLKKKTGINLIVLSGGVFQNMLLLRLSLDLLYKEGLQVFVHKNLACNDSSIALGQAMIAAAGRQ